MPEPSAETLIRDRITTIEEEVATLQGKLDPVMRSRSAAVEATAAPYVGSHVRGRLECIIDQLRDLNSSLEV